MTIDKQNLGPISRGTASYFCVNIYIQISLCYLMGHTYENWSTYIDNIDQWKWMEAESLNHYTVEMVKMQNWCLKQTRLGSVENNMKSFSLAGKLGGGTDNWY